MVFFFKQKAAYEMRISDWSSDVCSSDLFLQVEECPEHAALDDPDGRADRHPAQPDGAERPGAGAFHRLVRAQRDPARAADRTSVVWGKSVSVRVALVGRRIIKKISQIHSGRFILYINFFHSTFRQ